MRDIYASYINLDSRPDRNEKMIAELSRVSLLAYRTRGRLPSEFDLNDPKLQTMRNRTPGAIGCHFSQVQVMKVAQAMDQHALIMEDDLIFCSDIHERLDYIGKWTEDHDWDVIWLGATFHVPAFWHRVGKSGMPPNCSAQLGKDCEVTDDPRMIRTYGAFSTHAYLVNCDSIPKLLDLFEAHLHESIGIDWLMIKLQPQLKCFSFVPGCVKQYDNQSNIGTGITKWSGFLKLNGTYENSAYVWQDKMTDFQPEKFNWNGN
jgi:GR25 family glycosyltransferase involved in LPS biosynthesis